MEEDYWCLGCGDAVVLRSQLVRTDADDASAGHRFTGADRFSFNNATQLNSCPGPLFPGRMPLYECGACGEEVKPREVTFCLTVAVSRVGGRVLLYHRGGGHPPSETPGPDWLKHKVMPIQHAHGAAATNRSHIDACGPLYLKRDDSPPREMVRSDVERAVRAASFPSEREEAVMRELEYLFRTREKKDGEKAEKVECCPTCGRTALSLNGYGWRCPASRRGDAFCTQRPWGRD